MRQRLLSYEPKKHVAGVLVGQRMNLTVKSGTSATLSDGTQEFGLTDVQRSDGSIGHAVKTTRNAPYLIADCAAFIRTAGIFCLRNPIAANDNFRRMVA
jgi:hypothetical protein